SPCSICQASSRYWVIALRGSSAGRYRREAVSMARLLRPPEEKRLRPERSLKWHRISIGCEDSFCNFPFFHPGTEPEAAMLQKINGNPVYRTGFDTRRYVSYGRDPCRVTRRTALRWESFVNYRRDP